MATLMPQRIVELRPALTEQQRAALVDIAESAVTRKSGLCLTDDEAAALAASRIDFKTGQTLSFAEAEAATDAMLRGLRATA
jgi:hypothetical protein